jgi:predicted nuclease with RNAse H fold
VHSNQRLKRLSMRTIKIISGVSLKQLNIIEAYNKEQNYRAIQEETKEMEESVENEYDEDVQEDELTLMSKFVAAPPLFIVDSKYN